MEEEPVMGSFFFFVAAGRAEVAGAAWCVSRGGGVVPGCPLPGFGIHAHLDRGARPLVDEALLRAEPPSAVCDADFDFEGCRVADVVAGRQRMGYDIDVEQKVSHGPVSRLARPSPGIPAGFSRRVRADVGDMAPRPMRSPCGCLPCRSSRTSVRRCSATSLRSGSKSRL